MPDEVLENEPEREYGVLASDDKVMVGPGWTCVADVIGSAHGFDLERISGKLVFRTEDNPVWVEA